jgi:hypothetical protein
MLIYVLLEQIPTSVIVSQHAFLATFKHKQETVCFKVVKEHFTLTSSSMVRVSQMSIMYKSFQFQLIVIADCDIV